jgi:hypothetical protein
MARRPSPALVIALIALFVSLGGVSFGAAALITGKQIKNNTVGTKDLKNNDVRGKDVRNNTLTGSDVNESRLGKVQSAANADNSAKLGGADPSTYAKAADILHATVNTSATAGTLVRGRGATTISRIGIGFYAVTFNRDVSNCTWQASAGRATATGVSDFNATPRGVTNGSPNQVGVVVWNQAGNQIDGPTFFLTVFC